MIKLLRASLLTHSGCPDYEISHKYYFTIQYIRAKTMAIKMLKHDVTESDIMQSKRAYSVQDETQIALN